MRWVKTRIIEIAFTPFKVRGHSIPHGAKKSAPNPDPMTVPRSSEGCDTLRPPHDARAMDQAPTTPAARLRKRQRRVPRRGVAAFVVHGVLCAGCATNLATYDELATAIKAGDDVDAAALRAAFVATPDFSERLRSISGLESQAIRLMEEEPLRLGPLGSAIVNRYAGSLAGHHALATFYAYLERDDAAAAHRDWVQRIRKSIADTAGGTLESPLPAISPAEPDAYLMASGRMPVGSIYVPTEEAPLLLKVAAKPAQGRIEDVYFDLRAAYAEWLQEAEKQDRFHSLHIISRLADSNDSAARTFLGTLQLGMDRLDQAAAQLAMASRSGNLLAHVMLARVYWTKSLNIPPGPEREAARLEAARNYEIGIDLGSDEAMFELGTLWAAGVYGSELRDKGLELVEQAVALDNSEACLFLAQWFEAPPVAEPDYEKSEAYYLRAASLDNATAKIDYARFLMRQDLDYAFTDQAYRWLTGLANSGRPCEDLDPHCADARVLLGNLFAKGVHVRRSYRKARSWFRSAVAASPERAQVVNEVAWTLTVSNLERLRDERYALKIMDHVMTNNENARGVPAYIDTWAAAYAANGDFERAVELQREALHEASANEIDDETIEILREHLQEFEAGRTIIELIP